MNARRRRTRKAQRARREEQPLPCRVGRRRVVLVLFGCAICALVWRAVDRQIFEKDYLQSEGADRYLEEVKIPVHRGVIADRHGALLAVSTPVESVGANPRLLSSERRVLQPLAKALGISVATLRRRLTRFGHLDFVYLRRGVTPSQSAQVRAVVERYGLSGVRIDREYRRYYPTGEVFAHVLGFTNVDDEGQEGLELAFDTDLRGEPGLKRALRDGRSNLVGDIESLRMPRPGTNLALSLDQRLQYIAYRELLAACRKHRARSGAAVLLDARSGEILALVSQPGYNPNGSRENRNGRLRNRALTDVFEPGSTMKPFTVAVGLETRQITSATVIDTSPGFFHVGRHPVRDHDDLGRIDLQTLLQKSSNVGASKIALALPPERLWSGLRDLGFGDTTGVRFPGEASGQLTVPSRWAEIDRATLAFGYGISATTLQLAQAYAVLANDGMRRPLSMLRRNRAPAGERVFSATTARTVRFLLESVVADDGTAPLARVPGYRVAGKTGTVKKFGPDGYSDDRYVALFAGMAPASDPRLVMAIMIDEPRGEKFYGGDVAAPVFARVMGDALRLLNVTPDAVPVERVRLARIGGDG